MEEALENSKHSYEELKKQHESEVVKTEELVKKLEESKSKEESLTTQVGRI